MVLAAAPALPADLVQPAPRVALAAGDTLESALQALNAGGVRISYSSALVLPGMRLQAVPKAATVEALLREILTPWKLRAVLNADGEWLVVAAIASAALPGPRPDVPLDDVLETINVTASRYGLATAGNATFLDREDVDRMPHLGDDAVRMLKVLPGVSGGDYSAALNIRGGRRDETQLIIDGAEIHNGFHFRELDGALSVLDTHLVRGIEFITGGMTVEHGDYMSGVVDMRTHRPSVDDAWNNALGISFVSAFGRTGGTWSEGRGSWVASVRRGYLDVVLERVQEDDEKLTPRYNDLFAAVYYDIGERTSLAAHLLLGTDELRLISEDDDSIDSAGEGQAGHFWITLEHAWSDSLDSKTVLAVAQVEHRRDSEGEEQERAGDVLSDFDFRFLDLRQDWSWNGGERHLPRWGFNASRQQASYDYLLTGVQFNPLAPGGEVDISRAHDLDLSGSKYGAYASWRTRVTHALTAEAGARWDTYRYPGGLKFDEVSPRLNVVYSFGERDVLRAAWSVMHQPHGLSELAVEDDVTDFSRPERSRQAVIGYTRQFTPGFSARVDVYQKDYSHLRPRFENALDSVELIPEGEIDRIRIDAPRAQARGIELTLRREAERGMAGWLSVGWARARDQENGRWVARSWEQEHSLSFGSSWTGARWNISLAGLFHNGTPTTDLSVRTVPLPGGGEGPVVFPGPRNGERLGSYSRIDLRANRDVHLARGKFSYYLEVTNLLNRKNPCCIENVDVYGSNASPRLYVEQGYWLPMLPSFGFQYEF